MHHSVQISNWSISQLGFSGKQRLHGSPENSCERTPMKTERCMTQTKLAERWRISEATLERWRTESAGPLFLKLGNQVRYRVQDVEAFEEVALRGSTKIDGGVDQSAIPRPASQRPATISRPARPITIWLRTAPRKTSLRPSVAGRQR
jgi:hypothetical protein